MREPYIAVKYTLILGNSVIAPALLYLLHPCSRAPGVALPPASVPSYPSPCGLCLPEGDGGSRDPPFGIGGRGMRKNLVDGVLGMYVGAWLSPYFDVNTGSARG